MPDFGASIPAKVYQRFGYVNYTRRELAQELARALDAVGMVFHEATSSWNILDPATNVSAYTDQTNGQAGFFFFTFPTAETFERQAAGSAEIVQYKPCIVMVLGGGTDGVSYTQAVYPGVHIEFHLAMFRATDGAPSMANAIGFNTLRNAPTAMRGFHAATYSDAQAGDLNRYQSWPRLTYWKPYPGSAWTTVNQLLQVKSVTVHLGPGGLIIAGGAADNPADKANIASLFNYICVFGGKRVPNRARLPANDKELTRFCPVHEWFAGVYDSTYFTSADGPRSRIRFVDLFAQYGDRDSLADYQALYTEVHALDLFDQRYGTLGSFPTVISPRIIGGVARNILSPLVLVPRTGYETLTTTQGFFYPRTEDGVYDLQTWEDMYYTDTFRTSDPSLPLGENVDPDTGTKWWGHYLPVVANMCAYKLGASYDAMSTLPVRAYGTDVVHAYDFTNVTVVSGVANPVGNGLASAVTVTMVQISGSQGAFSKVAGQNYFESTFTSSYPHSVGMEFEIDLPAGIDSRWLPVVNVSAYLRGGRADTPAQCFAQFDVRPNYANNPGWSGWQTIAYAAGSNTGHAMYTYAPRDPAALRAQSSNSDASVFKIRFRISHYITSNTSVTYPQTFRVGDISLSFRRWQ